MSVSSPELAALAHLLPEERVGAVAAVRPIAMGLSGASVYAVSSARGELVLRVSAGHGDASHWAQQLRVWRRAAERGVAPAIVHVDEAARAVVSVRAGVPLASALADPGQRGAAIAGVVAQLRALRALDTVGVAERDPLALARREHAAQRARPSFPAWAAALEPVLDAIEETLSRDPRRALSHNDLNPGNILWDGARAWLVDWEVAGLTHPLYDLAALAMFLQLDDATAHDLLAQLEQRPIDDGARAAFAALRRLAGLLCGLGFASLVPDLRLLPPTAPTLPEFYAELRAGTVDLQDPRGRGAFALALLRFGVERGPVAGPREAPGAVVRDEALRREILDLIAEDDRVRARLAADGSLFAVAGYHPEMEAVHRRNAARLRSILEQRGWPGRSLVGEDGSESAFRIAQHAIGEPAFQREVLSLLIAAVARGEAEPLHLAMLEDRIRVFEGRPQRHGTQYDWDDGGQWMEPMNGIEDPDGLDERRAAVGLGPMEWRRPAPPGEPPPGPAAAASRRAEMAAWTVRTGWRPPGPRSP